MSASTPDDSNDEDFPSKDVFCLVHGKDHVTAIQREYEQMYRSLNPTGLGMVVLKADHRSTYDSLKELERKMTAKMEDHDGVRSDIARSGKTAEAWRKSFLKRFNNSASKCNGTSQKSANISRLDKTATNRLFNKYGMPSHLTTMQLFEKQSKDEIMDGVASLLASGSIKNNNPGGAYKKSLKQCWDSLTDEERAGWQAQLDEQDPEENRAMFPVIALHMLTKMQECLGDSILSLTCTYMTEEGPKVEIIDVTPITLKEDPSSFLSRAVAEYLPGENKMSALEKIIGQHAQRVLHDTNKKTIPRFVPGDYQAMNLISVVRCIMAYWEQCWIYARPEAGAIPLEDIAARPGDFYDTTTWQFPAPGLVALSIAGTTWSLVDPLVTFLIQRCGSEAPTEACFTFFSTSRVTVPPSTGAAKIIDESKSMSPAGVEMTLPEDEELLIDHDAEYFQSNGVYLNPELQPTGEEDGEDSISPQEPQTPLRDVAKLFVDENWAHQTPRKLDEVNGTTIDMVERYRIPKREKTKKPATDNRKKKKKKSPRQQTADEDEETTDDEDEPIPRKAAKKRPMTKRKQKTDTYEDDDSTDDEDERKARKAAKTSRKKTKATRKAVEESSDEEDEPSALIRGMTALKKKSAAEGKKKKKKAIKQTVEEDGESTDDEERDKKTRRKKADAGWKKVVQQTEEEDSTDDEDEPEAPKRGKAALKKKPAGVGKTKTKKRKTAEEDEERMEASDDDHVVLSSKGRKRKAVLNLESDVPAKKQKPGFYMALTKDKNVLDMSPAKTKTRSGRL